MSDRSALLRALDGAGRRRTGPRRELAALIADFEGAFTAADLSSAARRRGLDVGRATVFRTLDLLQSVGAVERIDLPEGEHAYVACIPSDHHHHVICTICGLSTDVRDPGMVQLASTLAAASGYRIDTHRLELFGVCPACQASGRG
jgi:Fur family ferric uptake transcriptional regulator